MGKSKLYYAKFSRWTAGFQIPMGNFSTKKERANRSRRRVSNPKGKIQSKTKIIQQFKPRCFKSQREKLKPLLLSFFFRKKIKVSNPNGKNSNQNISLEDLYDPKMFQIPMGKTQTA
jgi:hypothetical protein